MTLKIRIGTLTDTPVGPVAAAWHGSTVVAVMMQEATRRSDRDRPAYARPAPATRIREYLAARFPDAADSMADKARALAAKLGCT